MEANPKFKLYLAHPLRSRKYIREWELKIEENHQIELANPFYDRDGEGGRQDINLMDKGEKPTKQEDHEFNLVQKDIQLIGESQGILAIIDGNLSYGTIMEIVYGNILKKPVFITCTNDQYDHPWFVYHAQKIFRSFEEFEAQIENIPKLLKNYSLTGGKGVL